MLNGMFRNDVCIDKTNISFNEKFIKISIFNDLFTVGKYLMRLSWIDI